MTRREEQGEDSFEVEKLLVRRKGPEGPWLSASKGAGLREVRPIRAIEPGSTATTVVVDGSGGTFVGIRSPVAASTEGVTIAVTIVATTTLRALSLKSGLL